MKKMPEEKRFTGKTLSLLLLIVLVVVGLDQLTKIQVEEALELYEIVPVIDGVFNLTLNYNKGAAFGIFADLPDSFRHIVLWGVSGIAFIAILYFLFVEYATNMGAQLSLALILGGAIGNGIDRASRGEVVDFLDFYYGTYHWPAFNVADSAISVGAVLLVIISIFYSRREPSNRDRVDG